jgi:hypothetical protein
VTLLLESPRTHQKIDEAVVGMLLLKASFGLDTEYAAAAAAAAVVDNCSLESMEIEDAHVH